MKDELRNFKTETRQQFKQMDNRFDAIEKKLDDAYVENRASDLLKVKHDEVHLMKQQVKDHEERIGVLER